MLFLDIAQRFVPLAAEHLVFCLLLLLCGPGMDLFGCLSRIEPVCDQKIGIVVFEELVSHGCLPATLFLKG